LVLIRKSSLFLESEKKQNTEVDLSGLSKGVYFVRVISGEKVVALKLVKE